MTEILSQYWQIILLFFLIALLYSAVGFGGGSSYLAIRMLYDLKFGFLLAASLLCNILVVSNNSFQFYRKGYLDFKKMIPLFFFLRSTVAMGRFIGSFLGKQMLSSTIIKKTTAVLIGYVSYTILSKYL